MACLYDIPPGDVSIYLAETQLFIECFDVVHQNLLLEDFMQKIEEWGYVVKPEIRIVSPSEYTLTIGNVKIDDETVAVCLGFRFIEVNDVTMCFYKPTSMVIDHRVISQWFNKFFYNVRRTTDHMVMSNFCEVKNKRPRI